MKPGVLLISDQIMLKAANQVLFQTVRGLLEDDFRVCLILDGKTGHDKKNIASLEELFPDFLEQIEVHYYNAYGSWLFSFLSTMKSFIKKRKRSDLKSAVDSFPSSDTITGFDKTRTGFTYISDLKFELKWIAAFRTAKKASKGFVPELICGFEIGGAIPAEKLSNFLGIPFYTKYMGSIVFPYIESNSLHKVKPYVKGLTVKSHLHFMHNDGTKGDKAQIFLGVSPEKIRLRIDGVEKAKFINLPDRNQCRAELKLPLKNDDFVCLSLSNHNAGYKRLDRAIRAISELCRVYPKIKLILVGEGQNTQALKDLAEVSGSKLNILFLPKVTHQQVPLILNLADVYLNTNDVSNLSHPVLEAMISGTAVVSMSDGSLDGVIDSGKTGLLIDPTQCSLQLPKAIETLYKDRKLLNHLGENAKNFAINNLYSWDEKNRIELDEIRSLLH